MAEGDPVQPPEGQGGQAGGTPYQEYLDRIPEEVRGEVEPVFRDWDANTTRRFQESAEYKRGWEPYEQLGLNQVDPGEVEWLMQFREALSDPTAIQEWYQRYAQERGLQNTPPAAEDDQFVDPTVAALVEQQLQAQLGPVSSKLEEMSQWRANQEQQAREAQAMTAIKAEMSSLKEKHPEEFDETMVEKFIANYIETDPQNAVQRAFSDWQTVRNQIEKQTLQGKANTPAGAESGGSAAGNSEPAKTLQEAAAQALEQLRADKRA